jgi:hypothetical protein
MDSTVLAALIGAGATVFTGLVAVGGAVWVGLRQVRIADRQADIQAEQAAIAQRQTEIQDRQVKLVDVNNRIQIFDRRMRLYHDARTFLHHFIPEEQTKAVQKRLERFIEHLNESRFLFDVTIYNWMTEILHKQAEYRFAYAMTISDEQQPNAEQYERELTEIYLWSTETSSRMHKVFAPFLNIVPSEPLTEHLKREGAALAERLKNP